MKIIINSDQIAFLKSEILRTGFDVRSLKHRSDVPAGLDVRQVRRWIKGWVVEVPSEHFDYIVGLLSTLPDYGASGIDGYIPKSGRRVPPSASAWLELTSDMTDRLEAELKRTGASLSGIARAGKNHVAGLSMIMLSNWRNGKTATVNPDHWDFVLRYLTSLPDKPLAKRKPVSRFSNRHKAIYRPITDDEYHQLIRHEARTGLSGSAMYVHAKRPPRDLDGNMVAAWLRQQTLSASPQHIAFVLRLYASLPDAPRRRST